MQRSEKRNRPAIKNFVITYFISHKIQKMGIQKISENPVNFPVELGDGSIAGHLPQSNYRATYVSKTSA